ncbi:hypothetical protein BASA81_005743, partial [Batrachochytrium salamandrivorans]
MLVRYAQEDETKGEVDEQVLELMCGQLLVRPEHLPNSWLAAADDNSVLAKRQRLVSALARLNAAEYGSEGFAPAVLTVFQVVQPLVLSLESTELTRVFSLCQVELKYILAKKELESAVGDKTFMARFDALYREVVGKEDGEDNEQHDLAMRRDDMKRCLGSKKEAKLFLDSITPGATLPVVRECLMRVAAELQLRLFGPPKLVRKRVTAYKLQGIQAKSETDQGADSSDSDNSSEEEPPAKLAK